MENLLTSSENDIAGRHLSDLIDIERIQIMLSEFSHITGVATAIIDLKGNILASAGWKEICEEFHRKKPETRKMCMESDLHLSRGVKKGDFRLYRCRNNLWDMATPVFVRDQHIGNVLCGQVLLAEDKPEEDVFRKQAGFHGFPEQKYLDALAKVPRLNKNNLSDIMNFLSLLAEMISELASSNLRQQQVRRY